MSTITRSFARFIVLPAMTAGVIGCAALGLAGQASASSGQAPTGPGYSYAPTVKAEPAPTQAPGWQAHHGPQRFANR
jgi:hypothetical protein